VEVTALFVRDLPNGGMVGSTNQVRITIEASPSKEFRVGIFEGEVAGSGPMWRAAGWLASVVAAGFVDMDLANTRVSFDIGGQIDGPSAGGLMTVGLIAALRGDKVREDAAMTGTINPDGSIGAVGGVPHKIEGAAKAGKKLVLVPSGTRVQRDHNLKKDVDIIDHGKAKGVEVREVADLYAAYELLTGKELPRLARADAPEISDGKAYERLRTKTTEWLARYKKAQEDYAKLPDEYKPEELAPLIAGAKKSADLAERLLKQGVAGAAWAQARNATFMASSSLLAAQIVGIYAKNEMVEKGHEEARGLLNASMAIRDKESDLHADRLEKLQPKTLGEIGTMLSAWGTYSESLGYRRLAAEFLSRKQANDRDKGYAIGVASTYLNHSILLNYATADFLDIGTGLGGPALPDQIPVDRVASFYRNVAKANLNVMDTLIDSGFESQGFRLEKARQAVLDKDRLFALSWTSLHFTDALKQIGGNNTTVAYARLGAALNAYCNSCSVTAKYGSLECKIDENREPTEITNDRVLVNMLDLADSQARQSISFLRQRKVEVTPLIITYETARLLREGGLGEKLEALQDYWQIHAQARAMAYIGGITGPETGNKFRP